ncbi:phenylalanine--tRNA ligase subunit alpha [Candidatus Vampirococcus lugosii]|uniref:Phenylalanine--tRNA ligase alpha subunit n=1 Tax=Candidatus Vampirococcus lugosii TaxID=2789015 RepID=A0ABS5QP35_9BACT|nr:phenylalanine--tRNA ligase subunit alpha [Candidatus Vampirococcus lugosii]MBS8122134.1 phenylalanyl-tRNA synthetase subunit alpha [Candidatus Vampirococcus lugosii]
MINKDEILKNLDSVCDVEGLQSFHGKYLGKKSQINEEFKTLGKLSPEERKEKGQFLSSLKNEIQIEFDKKQNFLKKEQINKKLNNELIDIGIPSFDIDKGYLNLISKTRRQIEEISRGMGFIIEKGDSLVSKYENFNSLNVPSNHPATEMHDTIFLTNKDEKGEEYILRTHTSAKQNDIFKKYGAPSKVVIPGKVYRYENLDSSHDSCFRQYEGIVVGENISMAELKYTLRELLSKILENDELEIRMRPGYFPFVEPGMEIDASCPICKGKGCSLCKGTGWIEILGAGMIHPNVLKEGGIDTEKYSGFAFGMGMTRLIAVKYGIKDIRLLTNGDIRFIKSF